MDEMSRALVNSSQEAEEGASTGEILQGGHMENGANFDFNIDANVDATNYDLLREAVPGSLSMTDFDSSLDSQELIHFAREACDAPNSFSEGHSTAQIMTPWLPYPSTVQVLPRTGLVSNPSKRQLCIQPALSRVPPSQRPTKRSRATDQIQSLAGNSQGRNVMPSKDSQRKELVSRLYDLVGCTEIISERLAMTSAMNLSDGLKLQTCGDSVLHILDALDRVEAGTRLCALNRRVLLLQLVRRRNQLKESCQQRRERNAQESGPEFTGKLETAVLDAMIKDAFPKTGLEVSQMNTREWRDKHVKERTRIQNRLYAARNWNAAVQRFGYGIIALFPIAGEFQIPDSR